MHAHTQPQNTEDTERQRGLRDHLISQLKKQDNLIPLSLEKEKN